MQGRREKPRRILLAAGIAALVLLLGFAAVRLVRLERRSGGPETTERLQQAATELDEIAIKAQLHPDSHSMTVRQTLQLTSRTAEGRDTLVLRTWPNAFQKPDTSPVAGDAGLCPDGFSAGSLVMEEAAMELNGQQVRLEHRYADAAKTVLELPLPEIWQPGESLTVTLCYTVNFPHIQYRFGWWGDTFAAGHAFAVPALWQNGAYRTDAWLPVGDPLSGECMNWTLTLRVPKTHQVAATGRITGTYQNADGTDLYIIDAPAVREMGLVISPEIRKVSRQAGGVQVEAWAANPAQARRLLDTAAKAVESFSGLYGDYPYPVYTVCALPMGVSGAEYPGLSLIDADLLTGSAETLEYAVVHETAHQWWYSLVGSDSSTHPWLDEAMCEYSLLSYVEACHGRAAREELRQSRMESSMRVTVAGQATPGAPLDYFETNTDYMVLVYGRAASMLCAVDELLGGRLDETLRAYADRYAFQMADRSDFLRLVQENTGVDIEPLMADYLDTYLIN